ADDGRERQRSKNQEVRLHHFFSVGLAVPAGVAAGVAGFAAAAPAFVAGVAGAPCSAPVGVPVSTLCTSFFSSTTFSLPVFGSISTFFWVTSCSTTRNSTRRFFS